MEMLGSLKEARGAQGIALAEGSNECLVFSFKQLTLGHVLLSVKRKVAPWRAWLRGTVTPWVLGSGGPALKSVLSLIEASEK